MFAPPLICGYLLLSLSFIHEGYHLIIGSVYEVSGGWRLHDEELHDLYSSPNIIRMIKSRRMKWEGHVARMRRRGMHVRFLWESQKERDHYEHLDVGGRMILKLILERELGGMDWIDLSQVREPVNTVMNLRFPQNIRKLLNG
jgi:hypothetical protein